MERWRRNDILDQECDHMWWKIEREFDRIVVIIDLDMKTILPDATLVRRHRETRTRGRQGEKHTTVGTYDWRIAECFEWGVLVGWGCYCNIAVHSTLQRRVLDSIWAKSKPNSTRQSIRRAPYTVLLSKVSWASTRTSPNSSWYCFLQSKE